MSTGPLPSTRCLLSELPLRPVGDKVRFLGCVDFYDTKTGILTLEHRYPLASSVGAFVDVNLLLKSLGGSHTDVGQWVHVLGYVTSIVKASSRGKSSYQADVKLQAIALWPADGLDIVAYECSISKPVA